MYAEDLDLCFKTRQNGFHNYYIGGAVIVHHGGGSSNQSVSNFATVMMRESVCRLLRKTRGRIYSYCYRAALSGVALIRMTLLGVLYPAWYAQGKKRRWFAAFHKWFGILRWGLGLERWILQYETVELPNGCSIEGAK